MPQPSPRPHKPVPAFLLAPVDGSESAWNAFDVALKLASINGDRILACTIADGHRLEGEYPQAASVVGALVSQIRIDAHQIVREAVRKAEERGIACEGNVLFADSPGDAIVSFARERSAGAIVMGTHGRSGLAHTVLGSVAERVLRSADCSVIAVRKER